MSLIQYDGYPYKNRNLDTDRHTMKTMETGPSTSQRERPQKKNHTADTLIFNFYPQEL